jgi:PTS system mannose-specific IIA component
MIGIVVVTHSDLGQGLLNAVALIAGTQPKARAIGLYHGDGVDDFEERVMAAINELDEGDGILVFTDFFGGTPSNTVMRCMAKKPFRCITGVNMPMMVEALTGRDGITPEQLEENCLTVGTSSILKLEDVFAENNKFVEEEEDESDF